ncbi:hypothetical protein Q8G35_23895 [Peribacillus simplex]|uniref:Uncharacterized protein n=2 Tax=Peribacillus TaxID=2675229 RepID=A0AA90SYA4_9BACI|nr:MULTISPECIES: hypothetical protein [Peribacillus]MDP1421334.1 hypothetical protein [Peribacillus simplex]MDP1454020.1 hypothetical protein [Peribacillus frigoritolerans]
MRMDMLVRDIYVFNSYLKRLKGMQPSRMESSIILENGNWMPSRNGKRTTHPPKMAMVLLLTIN